MKLQMEVQGLRELQISLRALPPKVQGRAARGALMAGAKLIRDRARMTHTWRDDTGFLRENIIMFSARKGDHGYADQVLVGVRKRRVKRPSKAGAAALARKRQRSRGKKVVAPYYWRFLEFGTSRMPARPFLRPAFESEKANAVRAITERLRDAIDRAARKVAG